MNVIYLDPLCCYLPHVKREEKKKGNHMLCECEKRKNPAEQGSGHMCECEKRKNPTELGSGHMWCPCSVKNGRRVLREKRKAT
jgi:hypothetical protein